MRRTRVLVKLGTVLLSVNSLVFAGQLSLGVVGGTSLTSDFTTQYIASYPFMPGTALQIRKSAGRSGIVGPTLEWRFKPRYSLEADALFRELRFTTTDIGSHYPTVTWEFPLLVKCRLGLGSLRPFIEGGPSFRATGNLNANPSHVGVSAGAGLDLRAGRFNIAPTLRYTRWRRDPSPFLSETKPDQLEVLLAFSYGTNGMVHALGNRVSIGAVLGTNFLGDYDREAIAGTDILTGSTSSDSTGSGSRSFLVGPTVEFQLTKAMSVEADAIYRPLRQSYIATGSYGTQSIVLSGESKYSSWQFPLLAKLSLWAPLGSHFVVPIVEAGPSLRISGAVSHFGVSAGTGVALRLGPIKVSPVLRYTRWQATANSNAKPNELNLLVGFLF